MSEKTLTYAERLILSNQFEILQFLNPSQKEHYRNSASIVEQGYEFLHGEISHAVSEKSIAVEFGREVYDILDLFRAIEGSAKEAGKSTADLDLEFEGFDANNDDDHYGFARYVRRDLGKWAEIEKYPDNSHSAASLQRYRLMLKRWRDLGKPFDMTEDQLVSLCLLLPVYSKANCDPAKPHDRLGGFAHQNRNWPR